MEMGEKQNGEAMELKRKYCAESRRMRGSTDIERTGEHR
jgi:hypothetical protein